MKQHRDYIRYDLAVRRHVILLRFGVALAIVLGVLNLVLHYHSRPG